MTVLLGGRAAEQLVFGAITTGAVGRSQARRRDRARDGRRVSRWAPPSPPRVPDVDGGQISQVSLRIRDEETPGARRGGRRAAQRLVAAHREQLDALAAELLRQEVLDRDASTASSRGPAHRARRRHRAARRRRGRARGPAPGGRETRNARRRRRARRPRRAPRGAALSFRARAGIPAVVDSPACSGESTTSAWPSRTSTPRCPCGSSLRDAASCTARSVEEQGVEAVLLDVGENHVELLAPLSAGHPRRPLPGQARARACTTSPTRSPTSTRRWPPAARRGCA